MIFKKFDIVLVNFPFSDLTKTKKRPALVINSLEGDNTIFCQITTKRRNIQKYEIILKKEDCEGNIRFDSFIYLDMIFTLHKSIVHGKIGEVKSSKVKELINQKLKTTF
ncbi:type II toxin-antitoxin system PemK/MazF family toxin [Candidatus Pacearchaeota archaeon]|nr:type II toxin-antitoxin system PemK/MazF family toxin [Candidatus Pacearchaeota archaeon]